MSANGRACGRCSYFQVQDQPEMYDGLCCRHAPVPRPERLEAGGPDISPTWPLVALDWWCGEFLPDDAITFRVPEEIPQA